MEQMSIIELGELRVLTTQQLAECYRTEAQVITNNYNRNKERYTEGKHFISLEGEDKRNFLNQNQIDLGSLKNAKTVYLWTERGAFLHAKSLNTDMAWEVYERLVETYFTVKDSQPHLPKTPMELLQLHYEAIRQVDEKVDGVLVEVDCMRVELDNLKMDLPILPIEAEKITEAVRKKGVKILGGKDSNAYKDAHLRSRLYTSIYADLKRNFGVRSYKSLKRNQCERAVAVIESYIPTMELEDTINDTNAQQSLNLE